MWDYHAFKMTSVDLTDTSPLIASSSLTFPWPGFAIRVPAIVQSPDFEHYRGSIQQHSASRDKVIFSPFQILYTHTRSICTIHPVSIQSYNHTGKKTSSTFINSACILFYFCLLGSICAHVG